MEATKTKSFQCPECLEQTYELVKFEDEEMCPECFEHFENDRLERELAAVQEEEEYS